MLGFFERQRLVKKGLASQKTRRRRTESEVLETMERGIVAKVSIVVAFAVALSWLLLKGPEGGSLVMWSVALLIFGTAVAHFRLNRPEVWGSNSRLLLLFLIIFVHLGLIKFFLLSADQALMNSGELRPGQWSAMEKSDLWKLAVPFTLAPFLASLLLGRTIGIIGTFFATLLSIPVMASAGNDLTQVIINMTTELLCGFLAIFLTLEVRKGSDLVRAGFFVGLATWGMAVVFQKIIFIHLWHAIQTMNWSALAIQTSVTIGGPMVLALVIYGALKPIEKLFRVTTNISWVDSADLNHPLLKRMTLEAPGTFQHSLAVANLAEAACESIGANATMARVCSYFHDIGKLVKPDYFTENLRNDRNPHEDLAPTMSALIIIAHVKEGVSLALEHGLNPAIIDVIQQHHGSSLVYYFYKKALDQQESARRDRKIATMHDEDLPEVSESSFRYGGPRPQTKESAIISLADSIESAARSMEKVTPQKIEQLISDIIKKRIADEQLDDCDLTFRELQTVAESFRHTLASMLHTRTAYPDEKVRREVPARRQDAPPATAA